MKLCGLLAASLLLAGSPLTAQQPAGPAESSHVRADGIQVLVVAENPFLGRFSIDSSRSLDDGSVQTTHVETTVARDSEGRVYRERHSFASGNSDEQSRLTNFFILDPVAHTRTSCNVTARHCDITRFHGQSFLRPIPDGSFDPGYRFVRRENLGSDVIFGLNVDGIRETTAFRGGWPAEKWQVGTQEFWYSTNLGLNLSATSKVPNAGTQAVRVNEVSLAEPDPAMFQIPANFVVEDHRQPQKPQN
jgi:hypothetical protein